MSKLEQFQDFIRSNGKDLTGVNVPVVLSNEEAKQPELNFTFGWTIEIGVSEHEHGGHCPAGIKSGSASNACNCANETARQYVNNDDSLFNDRFLKILGPDISKNFLIKDCGLQSAPETYVGSKVCYICDGTGEDTCSSCHGHGSTSCSSCSGRGSYAVTREENNRTVHSRESCSSCGGSGSNTCYNCNGRGKVTCRTCDGGGYLYFSYSIDGEAKRSTRWEYNTSDYHEWTSDYVKKTGLKLVHHLDDVTEVDVAGTLNGCSFIYAFKAKLPTLQFTANIDKVDTIMCFAGNKNSTHNAGGVYDPAVWSLAKKLAGGSKSDDKVALSTPAIKDIIESNETKTAIPLLEENWVSNDIKEAVVSNYQTLVTQLKKQSVKGIAPKMFGGFISYSFLFLILGVLFAVMYPSFAQDSAYRMSVLQLPEWFFALLTMQFGLFGLPAICNYLFFFGFIWLSYQCVKKWYWKNIGPGKTWLLALSLTLLVPHAGFTLFYNGIEVVNHTLEVTNALMAGSILVGLYLVVIGTKLPNKWYTKILGFIAGIGAYCGLHYGLYLLNSRIGFIENHERYPFELVESLNPGTQFMAENLIEWVILSVIFAYFLTRRQFWLKAKTAVADYDSPVLLKSMNMEK
ncbi:zinc finger-like domain-containing protein [Shewanella olleyana]|uniref:zinc finger-like domain-containing protein n=1 Tax=Shewanella olleyana TaxID=135626 RepID=UPI00201012F0|nr:zinc finger-like domain-containing protein [Shewanella olleyana]